MKKTFRIAIILIPVLVLVLGVVLWGNHYLKTQKAEPVKVYKSTPLQPNILPVTANTPKVTPVESEDNTDVTKIEPSVTTQHIDDITISDETDNTGNLSAGTIFGDITEQNLPPEAAAALIEYEEAHSEYIAAKNVLKASFDTNPINWERIRSERANFTKAKEQRIDALSNLAVYLDEAFDKLLAIRDREYETDSKIAEMTETDRQEAFPRVKRVLDIFDAMSPEEREHLVEAIPNLKETIKHLQDETE